MPPSPSSTAIQAVSGGVHKSPSDGSVALLRHGSKNPRRGTPGVAVGRPSSARRRHPDQGVAALLPALLPARQPTGPAAAAAASDNRPLPALLALQGGTVVNADRQFKADVLIRDGLILRVAPELRVGAAAPTRRPQHLPAPRRGRCRQGWGVGAISAESYPGPDCQPPAPSLQPPDLQHQKCEGQSCFPHHHNPNVSYVLFRPPL